MPQEPGGLCGDEVLGPEALGCGDAVAVMAELGGKGLPKGVVNAGHRCPPTGKVSIRRPQLLKPCVGMSERVDIGKQWKPNCCMRGQHARNDATHDVPAVLAAAGAPRREAPQLERQLGLQRRQLVSLGRCAVRLGDGIQGRQHPLVDGVRHRGREEVHQVAPVSLIELRGLISCD